MMSRRRSVHQDCQKVLAFIGTTPNIGTTVCALATAYRINEATQGKVAFLCLNFKSSKFHRYLNMQPPHATVDELLPHLRNQSLTPTMLMNAMTSSPSRPQLYYLLGNRHREMAEYYSEDDVHQLISVARGIYDYVVIDCNAYWDNAGSLCSLQQADDIIIVTTTALSHFQEDAKSWYGTLAQQLGLEDKAVHGLIIRQNKQYNGFSLQDIERELQLEIIGDVLLPISLYESLDGGELDYWLTETSEGRNWLVGVSINLLPAQLSLYATRPQGAWRRMHSLWQRKLKQS